MGKNKSSISKKGTYKEIGEFWDNHDIADNCGSGKDVDFEVDIETEITYFALDKNISKRIQKAAKRHGVSSDTLVNIWLQDKLQQEKVY